MAERWLPPLQVVETVDGCCLSLGSWGYGYGRTLQEAADDLIARLLQVALSFRSSGFRISTECPQPDPAWLEFVWELGERAAHGEDIRPLVLGPPDLSTAE